LSSNVSNAFPKVLKLSSEVSECKPLVMGADGELQCNSFDGVQAGPHMTLYL
jgi:hypothetical protein